MIEAREDYAKKTRRLLGLVRDGKYGSAEFEQAATESAEAWEMLTPEEQADAEGRLLVENELAGQAEESAIPETFSWTPANATP